MLALRKAVERAMGDDGGHLHWGDDESAAPELLPSGLMQIDEALGGGIAMGRITEFVGEESAGKTLMAMAFMKAAIARDLPAVFIDVERTWTRQWAQQVGVDPARVLWAEPANAEKAFDIMHAVIKTAPAGIVVLDSIAALPPAVMLSAEKGMEQQFVGTQARLVNRGISIASAINNGWAIVLINQIREKVGVMYGSPETLPGGKGQNYFAWQLVRVRKGAALEEGTGDKKRMIGRMLRIRVDKSKQSPMGATAEIPFYFTGEFDVTSGIIERGKALGVISGSGGYYTFADRKWHGAKAMRDAFDDDALLAELRDAIESVPVDNDESF